MTRYSPAAAIAWEFRRRHRWGFIALGGYLIVLAAIKLLVVEMGRRINVDSDVSFALVVVVPMSATFTYFLAVFTLGLEGDLAARQSMYPARRLTLPVTTSALAGWPMLYGTLAMAALWAATRLLAVWPAGFAIPIVWPALLAASLLAWTQALTWMPYPLPGLRIVVATLWLAIIDSIVLLALRYDAPERFMVAILVPHVPLAYFAARHAVARARRGDVPDWRHAFARRETTARHRREFSSPAAAQAWFGWRQNGRSLPVWVAILLPLELALLRVTGDTPSLVVTILAGVLVTPVIMAVFTATTFNDSSGMSTFIGTRPLTSAALTAANLNAAIRSTALTWALVLAAIPVALVWTGRWPLVAERTQHAADQIGMPRVAVLVLLIVAGLIASTWKQLAQSLYIGLTGRERLIKGSVFVTLAAVFLVGVLAQWIVDSARLQRTLWDALPTILALLVCLKMSAAYWVATRLHRRRLVSDRTVVTGAACWCVAVLGLSALLVWWLSTPFFPSYVLTLVAILAIPLVRLSASPLALAWNRHR